MAYPDIRHHDAKDGVTCSCHQLLMREKLICRIRLQRAGHIPGSAYVEIDLHYPETGEKKRIVFSGDLGAPHAPLLPAPMSPYLADILVIESTHRDRLHEDRRTRRKRLGSIVEQVTANNGVVLIPRFQHRPHPRAALRAGRHHPKQNTAFHWRWAGWFPLHPGGRG